MSCAISTIKYILFLFNFVFTLTGILLIGIGIFVNSKASNVKELLAGNVSFASMLLIAVGVVVFLVAFFGCCGAIQESHCMIITYTICLLTIFFFEVGIGILAFVYKSKAQDYLSVTADRIFDGYNTNDDYRKLVDTVQREWKCCGTSGPASWAGKYPSSCCVDDNGRHYTTYTGGCPGEMYPVGCIEKLTQFAKDELHTLGCIAIGVASVELVGIVFSLCLASSIRRSELRGYA
ncbi:23 kDa integral membrane protein-like [Lycorma delicatula]|uniref:23 kDa integral membrane protein-like n=1 Tax=Lycorma delicatula TaxID=130591 RepID=UPI003F51421F